MDNLDSKEEYRYYELLEEKKAQGLIINFELQPKYLLQPSFKYNGKTSRAIHYIADFLIYHLDGTEEVIDIKGHGCSGGTDEAKDDAVQIPRTETHWLSRSEVGRHRRLD